MRRFARAATAAAAMALVAGACGGDDAASPAQPDGIPAERCEANRAAGPITFLTSFDYAAAASIIDVVAADAQGFFEAVCLDVRLQPGFSSDNVALVGAGRAQMTSLGSFSEVVVANIRGADLVAVAVEGKTSIEELLVESDSGITELVQLEGRRVGIKGAIPYSLRAMLARAGVEESRLIEVEVGFNPVTLFETDIDALPVYKSNEPGQLDAQGYGDRYRSFDPQDFDIPASFAVFTTSRAFADTHPTAVADFLRAALRGFAWAEDNPDDAVAATLERSDPDLFFDPDGERYRWDTERRLVRESTPEGQAVGAIDAATLEREVDLLVDLGVIDVADADAAASIDGRFMAEITRNGELVWFGD